MNGAALPAGPELDALVAERVLGWVRVMHDGRRRWSHTGRAYRDEPPRYSTDIAAAWHIVEWARGDDRRWELYYAALQQEVSRDLQKGLLPDRYVWQHVKPEHICRAALKAQAGKFREDEQRLEGNPGE
jgi:hypothetical protein